MAHWILNRVNFNDLCLYSHFRHDKISNKLLDAVYSKGKLLPFLLQVQDTKGRQGSRYRPANNSSLV